MSEVACILAKLPEISVTEDEPHLHTHQLVKVEVRYPCRCGEVVRTSEVLPRTALMDVETFSDRLRQITKASREDWEGHRRGER